MTSKGTQVYSAAKVFTGSEWLQDHSVIVENGKIKEIVPATGEIHQLTIAPAFIDIQIYGAYGQLFSVYQDTGSLQKLYEYCRSGGAAWFQPTVATNSTEVFYRCIDAVRAYKKDGGQGCLGLHIEGPWINPVRKGAHIESFIHSPSVEEVTALLDYGRDVITMITLAPEQCTNEVKALVRSRGVIISAGHSNATYDEATTAFNEGITTATHLFNAMSPFQHRATGLPGALFDHPTTMSSIIPDGYHVDYAAIRIAKKIMGERLFVITDAVTETTEGPYPHYLAGDKYEANGILSGSALTMARSVANLVKHAGIDLGEALRMASLYPAKVMKIDNRLGRIAPGYEASLVMLDDQLNVAETVTA